METEQVIVSFDIINGWQTYLKCLPAVCFYLYSYSVGCYSVMISPLRIASMIFAGARSARSSFFI